MDSEALKGLVVEALEEIKGPGDCHPGCQGPD